MGLASNDERLMKYRLKVAQLGLPAGTEFELNGQCWYESLGAAAGVHILPIIVVNNPDIFEPVRWVQKLDELIRSDDYFKTTTDAQRGCE